MSTLTKVLAALCLKCGHSYAVHMSRQVPWNFGGSETGFDAQTSFKVVGCTQCACDHPRFQVPPKRTAR